MPSLRIDKAFILLLLIVLILTASGVFIYLQIRTDKIASMIEDEQTLSFLLTVEEEDAIVFSEVVLFQNDTGKCALIDIPSNIGVLLQAENKIAALDTVFSSSNPAEYIEEVGRLLNYEIDHYLLLQRENLVKLIDLVEGLDLFIPNPIEFQEGEEIVLLPSGSITLDGEKSVLYSTYVEPAERENEVVARRQKFVQALLKRMADMNTYLQNREVQNTAADLFNTNLSERALSSLLLSFQTLDYDQVVFQRVLGNERLVGDRELLFPYYEGRLIKETTEQTLISLENKELISTEELNIKLEILNGTSQNGLAGRTSQVFKSFGYDVVYIGNADLQDYQQTIIISRNSDLSAAQQVANIIKCQNVESRPEEPKEIADPIQGLDAIDVTIILGKDFDGRYCKN